MLDIKDIMELLPHRYPFLLVDKVVSIYDDGIDAIKNVTINEPFFTGHFNNNPIMPGVLMIESLAQVSGIFCFTKLLDNTKDKFMYFAKIDNVKFKKPVIPGDTLNLSVKLIAFNGSLLKTNGQIMVDDTLVCSADLGLFLVERNEN